MFASANALHSTAMPSIVLAVFGRADIYNSLSRMKPLVCGLGCCYFPGIESKLGLIVVMALCDEDPYTNTAPDRCDVPCR